MAIATKLGIGLLVALASNVSLLSLLILRDTSPTSTITTTTGDGNDDGLKSAGKNVNPKLSGSVLLPAGEVRREKLPEDDSQTGARPPHFRRRGDVAVDEYYENERTDQGKNDPDAEDFPPRAERSTLTRHDTGFSLGDVIASLTDSEMERLPPSVATILVPALIGLESMVLRELEKLHDIAVHHELRLENIEKNQLQSQEIIDAANVIREEQYLLQRKQQKEALRKQNEANTSSPATLSTTKPEVVTPTPTPTPKPQEDPLIGELSSEEEVIVFHANSTANPLEDDGSGDVGSGDVPAGTVTVARTTAPSTTANYTESQDSAIINHIYEIYSSLTSMEHKVVELDTRLSMISTEQYRQRAAFIHLEDQVEENRRHQRMLIMKSTMHSFKLSDLEQFKSRAEVLLQTTEGTIEHFDAKLEVFKDRVTEQQDEMQSMRSVFGRLEQSSTELRAADAYKAHDIQEMKRNVHQLETRLGNLHHTVDIYIGNIRWDIKNHLDHLCTSNNLQC